jgi:FkbM family methyltransferase
MFIDPHFLRPKLRLTALACRWVWQRRAADALALLRDRSIGYEVLRWNSLPIGPCRTIIDVGAHVGAVAAALHLLYRPERLLAVEANPALLPGLRHRFSNVRSVEIVGVALNDQAGVLPFTVQNFSAASSFFPLQAGYLAAVGLPDGAQQIEIPARRLDDVAVEAGIESLDLLKLDCQGAELRVLLGAPGLLQRTRIVQTEVMFEPIYQGGALFHEVHALLRDHGFTLVRLGEFGGIGDRIDQADALYRRN